MLIWRAVKCTLILNIQISKELLHQAHKVNVSIPDDITRTLEKVQLKKVWSQLQQAQDNASDLREKFLDNRARFYAEQGNRTVEAIINQIKHTELIQQTYRKLRFVQRGNPTNSIDRIIVEAPDASMTVVNQTDEMHQILLQQNKTALLNPRPKLPTQQAFKEKCGKFGNGPLVKRLLEGSCDVSKISSVPIQQQWLKALECPRNSEGQPTDSITTQITTEDLRNLLKHTKERTASSPSGIHIGHYLASSFSDDLMHILTSNINMPFEHGFTTERWSKSIHQMLEKIPGRPLLMKLRIIQLLEADLNCYMKIKIG